ncbi:cystatin-2-like [Lepisosteus oculatus]|uniref:cystatin-2-like n=1 Tax=Lepisosteus oculatus TaxID=7918 RepID=UPI0035F504EF
MGLVWYSFCGLVCFAFLKASTQMVGDIREASVDDPGVLKSAQFAVDEYNKASNDMYLSKLIEITYAKQQVVNGIKYYLGVELGHTECEKRNFSDACSCSLPPSQDQTIFCRFEVLVVAWRNETTLLSMSC